MASTPLGASPATARKAAQLEGPIYAGVDVGGTNIKLGLVDDAGSPIANTSISTEQERGTSDAALRIAVALKGLVAQVRLSPRAVVRVGLATPGPMDIPRGMLICPGNLPTWHNTPIRDLVSRACDLPVTFVNDANAAAYGEYWAGAGRNCHSLVLFTMGTGIGGGIVVDDMLVEGLHSCGGELGHVIIDCSEDAPINTVGIRGSLEGHCGAYALTRRANQALAAGDASSLRKRLAGGDDLTPLLIAQEAEAGDQLAFDIVMQTARYMALGVVTAIHAIDPESVVIGGAMTFGGAGHPLGEKFITRLREETRGRLIPSIRDQVRIDFAALGSDAGFIGAAGLARRERQQEAAH